MPRIELNELRLAKSALCDTIFVGSINKKGNGWNSKVDVTSDFLKAAIDRWCGYKETITSSDGKKYEISVKEIKE